MSEKEQSSWCFLHIYKPENHKIDVHCWQVARSSVSEHLTGNFMKNVIMTLVIGFIIFEFIKHVIFPLFWYIKNRKKRSICGVTGMLGKVVEVKQWQTSEGRIFVNVEIAAVLN